MGKYLEDAVTSIISQEYPNLEYIIIDGGSTDNSIEIIRKYENYLTYWVSEKDQGLYYALNKGFSKSTGEIMGWLNSDDLLHKKSLFTLAEIFSNTKIEWLQGNHTWFDREGRIFKSEKVKLKTKFNYLLKEYHSGPSPFIQQESTYWKRNLWNRTGGYISTKYKLAGDFELWMRFFRYSNIYLTNSLIGGFRITNNSQLSIGGYQQYLEEADRIIEEYELNDHEKKQINRIRIFKKMPFFRKFPILGHLYSSNLMKLYGNVTYINYNPLKGSFELN